MTQPDFVAWLNRKPAGPKPKKPLPRVTKETRAKQSVYRVKAVDFKKRNPKCERCGFPGSRGFLDVHHKEGRGPNLLNEATWMSVCRPCHRWIHDNPGAARAKGWLK